VNGNSYHYGGEHVTQYGNSNIGMIKNAEASTQGAALDDAISQVQALRGHIRPGQRPALDEAIGTLRSGGTAEPRTLCRALEDVARIAATVGQIGAPVIDSIRRVMTTFDL
jgi:hypothetical protein